MKKLLFVFAVVAGLCAITFIPGKAVAQSQTEKQVEVKPPTAVKSAFDKEYPSAADVKWTKAPNNLFSAQFGSGIFRATVYYNTSGQRVEKDGNQLKRGS